MEFTEHTENVAFKHKEVHTLITMREYNVLKYYVNLL